MQERYFDALVKKEQMEEKMKGIREMKCRAVTCRKVLSRVTLAAWCHCDCVTAKKCVVI